MKFSFTLLAAVAIVLVNADSTTVDQAHEKIMKELSNKMGKLNKDAASQLQSSNQSFAKITEFLVNSTHDQNDALKAFSPTLKGILTDASTAASRNTASPHVIAEKTTLDLQKAWAELSQKDSKSHLNRRAPAEPSFGGIGQAMKNMFGRFRKSPETPRLTREQKIVDFKAAREAKLLEIDADSYKVLNEKSYENLQAKLQEATIQDNPDDILNEHFASEIEFLRDSQARDISKSLEELLSAETLKLNSKEQKEMKALMMTRWEEVNGKYLTQIHLELDNAHIEIAKGARPQMEAYVRAMNEYIALTDKTSAEGLEEAVKAQIEAAKKKATDAHTKLKQKIQDDADFLFKAINWKAQRFRSRSLSSDFAQTEAIAKVDSGLYAIRWKRNLFFALTSIAIFSVILGMILSAHSKSHASIASAPSSGAKQD
jgi:hypothetical protein